MCVVSSDVSLTSTPTDIISFPAASGHPNPKSCQGCQHERKFRLLTALIDGRLHSAKLGHFYVFVFACLFK
jgi:hypothetical protein